MTEEEKNNLAEKKIIKRIDYILDKANYLDFEGKKEYISFKREYLQDLFDLCKKQQKEIQSLESQLDFIGEQNIYIERQTIYLNKLEKELQGERIETEKMQKNYEAVIDKMEYEMGYEYISKDKIKEVLEKERKKQKERDDISLALHSQYISLIDKIKKQLLEE